MITKEPILIDTNIIYGLGKRIINESKKNKRKPINKIVQEILDKNEGILFNLAQHYVLLTSNISKYEFINRLNKDTGYSKVFLERIYEDISNHYKISMILFSNLESMNPDFFEKLLNYDIDLADGFQLLTAIKYTRGKKGFVFVTGNNNHLENMRKLYSEVITVNEAYKRSMSKK